jgi:AcrR family transcriptional regulator
MTRSYDQSSIQFRRFQDHLVGKEGKILLATFQCVAEVGIAATSTRAIAARAKLNQGIIHYYFRSKDELLARVLEIIFQNSTSNIEAIGASQLSPLEKLRLILEAGVSLIGPRRDEFVVFVAFWAHSIAVGGKMLELYRELFRRFRATVKNTVEEGENSGVFRAGFSEQTALLIVGAIEGLGIQYVIDPKQFKPDEAVSLLSTLLLNILTERHPGLE